MATHSCLLVQILYEQVADRRHRARPQLRDLDKLPPVAPHFGRRHVALHEQRRGARPRRLEPVGGAARALVRDQRVRDAPRDVVELLHEAHVDDRRGFRREPGLHGLAQVHGVRDRLEREPTRRDALGRHAEERAVPAVLLRRRLEPRRELFDPVPIGREGPIVQFMALRQQERRDGTYVHVRLEAVGASGVALERECQRRVHVHDAVGRALGARLAEELVTRALDVVECVEHHNGLRVHAQLHRGLERTTRVLLLARVCAISWLARGRGSPRRPSRAIQSPYRCSHCGG
ncbi:hypothetical protein PybrP1_004233 [[Pythium] brassicae (nom. inval.)]|nr:hypothetical protein PybrP1_004233 [[Pythium] brassicae (nom. inval.)]